MSSTKHNHERVDISSLRAIVEGSPVMVFQWAFSYDFPVTYVSDNVSQLGYTVQDFLSGRVSWPGITHPEDEPRLRAEVELALAAHIDAFSHSYRLRTASGQYRWMQDWNQIVRDADGTITHINAVITDITETVRARERYQTVVNSIQNGIIVMQDQRIVFVNRSLTAITGYSTEEFLAMGLPELLELIHPADQALVRDRYERRLHGEDVPAMYTIRVFNKAGDTLWLKITGERILFDGRHATQGVVEDITTQRRVENALRESETNFRTLAENAQAGIVIEDEKGRTVFANRRVSLLTGFPEAAILNMAAIELIHPEGRPIVQAYTQQRLRGEAVPAIYEARMVSADGRNVLVEVTGSRTTWHGQPATIGILQDITRRRAEELEHRRMQAMLEQAERIAMAGCWQFDIPDQRVHLSANLRTLFDIDPDQEVVTPADLGARIHPLDRAGVGAVTSLAIERGQAFTCEYRVVDRNGRCREVFTRAEFMPEAGGQPARFVGSTMDVTERRRLEREVLDIARREQQRLGHDLHDTLGQELTGMAFLAKVLEKQLHQMESDLAGAARHLSELAQRSVRQCRRIAHGLVPIDVVAESLAHELRSLCAGMTELYGIPCDCSIPGNTLVHDNKAATHLYHIATEAIVNAMRHANPTGVTVNLETTDDRGVLTVRDNGTWKDPAQDTGSGVGLRIMQHRADLIHAQLSTRHVLGEGTTVLCRFPNPSAPVST